MIRSLGRVAGVLFAVAAIIAGIIFTRLQMEKDPRRAMVTEALEATASLHQELGRDAHVSVTPAPGEVDDDAMDVKVVYPATTIAADRLSLQSSTNIIIRRYVHHVRDVKIAFGDTRSEVLAPLPPGNPDGGLAVPAADWAVPSTEPIRQTPPPEPQQAPPPSVGTKPGPPAAGKKSATAKKTSASAASGGTLTLVTFPESTVFRGNQQLGKTPLFNLELPVGTHLLTLVGPDGTRHALSAQVRPGKNPPMKVNLGDVPER